MILPTEVKISLCQQFVEFRLQYVEWISDTKSDKSRTILLYCSITDKENIHIPRTGGLEIPWGGGGGGWHLKEMYEMYKVKLISHRCLGSYKKKTFHGGGKYPTLATDTEVNSCFSIY